MEKMRSTKLDDILQCSICLDRFTRPKVLACQHTYCLSCLLSITAEKKIITCPQCRKEHPIPKEGIQNLPDNLIMNNLLSLQECGIVNPEPDLYGETAVLCLDCQNGVSVSPCDHCFQLLCTPCLVKHAKLSTQIEGNISDLRETLISERKECSDHVKKTFELMHAEQEKIDKEFDQIIEEVEKRRRFFHAYFRMLETLHRDLVCDRSDAQVQRGSGRNRGATNVATENDDAKKPTTIQDLENSLRDSKTFSDLESLKLKIADMKTATRLLSNGEVVKFVWEGIQLGRLARLEAGQSIVRIKGCHGKVENEEEKVKRQIDSENDDVRTQRRKTNTARPNGNNEDGVEYPIAAISGVVNAGPSADFRESAGQGRGTDANLKPGLSAACEIRKSGRFQPATGRSDFQKRKNTDSSQRWGAAPGQPRQYYLGYKRLRELDKLQPRDVVMYLNNSNNNFITFLDDDETMQKLDCVELILKILLKTTEERNMDVMFNKVLVNFVESRFLLNFTNLCLLMLQEKSQLKQLKLNKILRDALKLTEILMLRFPSLVLSHVIGLTANLDRMIPLLRSTTVIIDDVILNSHARLKKDMEYHFRHAKY